MAAATRAPLRGLAGLAAVLIVLVLSALLFGDGLLRSGAAASPIVLGVVGALIVAGLGFLVASKARELR